MPRRVPPRPRAAGSSARGSELPAASQPGRAVPSPPSPRQATTAGRPACRVRKEEPARRPRRGCAYLARRAAPRAPGSGRPPRSAPLAPVAVAPARTTAAFIFLNYIGRKTKAKTAERRARPERGPRARGGGLGAARGPPGGLRAGAPRAEGPGPGRRRAARRPAEGPARLGPSEPRPFIQRLPGLVVGGGRAGPGCWRPSWVSGRSGGALAWQLRASLGGIQVRGAEQPAPSHGRAPWSLRQTGAPSLVTAWSWHEAPGSSSWVSGEISQWCE